MLKPLPYETAEKKQLWQQLQALHPSLTATIDTLRDQFPGTKLVLVEHGGDTYYDPLNPPPKERGVYDLDEAFLLRLPAEDRKRYYYDKVNPPTAVEAAARMKKGKKR